MDEWIKAYQGSAPDAKINYEATGSGAGIQAFIAGTADFAGSDSALKPEEQPQADAKCAGGQAIHLPMVIGPIAVVYNVDGVDNLQLKPADPGRRSSPARSPSGTTRRSRPTTPAPSCRRPRSRPCTAPTSRAPPTTSPST